MSGQKSNCLELVEFQFNSEVSPAEAQQALQKLSEFAQSQPGFERRQFTEVQHPRYVDMTRLRNNKTISKAAAHRLASAYALVGEKDVAREILLETDWNEPESRYYYYTFGSSLRNKVHQMELLNDIDDRMRQLDKPIFITEFGVKGPEEFQKQWLLKAAETIREAPELSGICYFNMAIGY